MKGVTKIELFDSVSGKKQGEYVDHNMVTDALKCLYEAESKIGSVSAGKNYKLDAVSGYKYKLESIITNANMNLFLLEEEQDPVLIPKPYRGKLVGEANNTYIDANVLRGNLNATESIAIPGGRRLVYDFATDRGNGTIRCVSLGLPEIVSSRFKFLDNITNLFNAEPLELLLTNKTTSPYNFKLTKILTNKLKKFNEVDVDVFDIANFLVATPPIVNSLANDISYIGRDYSATIKYRVVNVNYKTGQLIGIVPIEIPGITVLTGVELTIGGTPTLCVLYKITATGEIKIFDGVIHTSIGFLQSTGNSSELLIGDGWVGFGKFNHMNNVIDLINNTVTRVNMGIGKVTTNYYNELGVNISYVYDGASYKGLWRASLLGLPFTINNLATPVVKTSTQTMKITYEITA